MVLHLNTILVTKGQHITAGTPIGLIGATGHSEGGSHAHCSLYKNIQNIIPSLNQTAEQWLSNGHYLQTAALNFPDPGPWATPFEFDAAPGGTGCGGSGNEPLISTNSSLVLCPDSSATLTAISGMSYYWNTGDTSKQIVVTQGGTYTVIVTDSNNTQTISQSITVTNAVANSNDIFHETVNICSGNMISLSPQFLSPSSGDEVSSPEAFLFTWSTGVNTSYINISQPGTYIVSVTNSFLSCFNHIVDSITVVEINNPTQPIIQMSGNVLASNTIQGCTYQWFLNGNPVGAGQFINADTIGSGFYTVAAINSSGCSTLSNPFILSGIDGLSAIEMLEIYPNPNNGIFTLFLKSETEKSIEIACINLLGEKIYQKQFELGNGELKTELNFLSQAKGLYLIRITANGKFIYRKVTISE